MQHGSIADVASNLLKQGLVDNVPDATRYAIYLLAAADRVVAEADDRPVGVPAMCAQVA